MTVRDEVDVLINRLPEEELYRLRDLLQRRLTRPKTPPEIEQIRRRSVDFRNQMQTRLLQLRTGGEAGSLGGRIGRLGGFREDPERGSYGMASHSWWEDLNTYMTQRFTLFKGNQIEATERLTLPERGDHLIFSLDLRVAQSAYAWQQSFPTGNHLT